MMQYLKERPLINYAYWSYNGYKSDPDSDEGYGLLMKDMKTVRYPQKLEDLQSI
jgi:hypothetical protein